MRRAAPAFVTGAWAYRADPGDRGRALGWPRRAPAGMRDVALPFVPNGARIAGPAGVRGYAGSVGWLRTGLQVNRAGRYALGFGSANYAATVWIDGRHACAHAGAYVPFDCPARLSAGLHLVMVRLDWRDPATQAARPRTPSAASAWPHCARCSPARS